MISIDVTKADEYEDKGFDAPFLQGWHTFIVDSVEVKIAVSSGTEYIQCVLYCKAQGRKIWDNHYVNSSNAYPQHRFKEFLEMADVNLESSKGEFDEQTIVGAVFLGKIKNKTETYNGEQKIKSQIDKYAKIDDDTIKTVKAIVEKEKKEKPVKKSEPLPVDDTLEDDTLEDHHEDDTLEDHGDLPF